MAVEMLERTTPAMVFDRGVKPADITESGPPVAAGASGKPLTRPEFAYLVLLIAMLAIGFGAALALDTDATWVPTAGISAFAMIFVLTAAVERVLEIFSPFLGRTTTSGASREAQQAFRKATGSTPAMPSRSTLSSARDQARVTAEQTRSSEHVAAVAWFDELITQARHNTSTIWALGAAMGMALSAQFGVLFLHSLGVTEASRPMDFLITGLVIGGGTKGLHELIGNLQASKDAAKEATT